MSLILGIESSCDESAVAVVENGSKVLASAVASQIASHAVHGGVVPELAAREHLTALPRVLEEALNTAGVTLDDISGIAVTQGPGLMPALLVGLNFAKAVAFTANKPLFGVNHFLAHIYGSFLDGYDELLKDEYPLLTPPTAGFPLLRQDLRHTTCDTSPQRPVSTPEDRHNSGRHGCLAALLMQSRLQWKLTGAYRQASLCQD